MLRIVTILIITATLTGCPSASTQYLANPETVTVLGPYTHDPSGMMFPLTVGDFRRAAINRYDAQGTDVSVGYDLYQAQKALAATIYVYPSPSIVSIGSPPDVVETARSTLCQNEYETRKQEIISAHPGAKLLNEDGVASPYSGGMATGKSAIFEFVDVFSGTRQTLQSRLDIFCYVGGKWTVKYRFTYPSSFDAQQDLDRFITNLPWPQKSS